jgi:hypothetical protein
MKWSFVSFTEGADVDALLEEKRRLIDKIK